MPSTLLGKIRMVKSGQVLSYTVQRTFASTDRQIACMEESRLAFLIESGLNLKESEMDTEGEKFKDIAK